MPPGGLNIRAATSFSSRRRACTISMRRDAPCRRQRPRTASSYRPDANRRSGSSRWQQLPRRAPGPRRARVDEVGARDMGRAFTRSPARGRCRRPSSSVSRAVRSHHRRRGEALVIEVQVRGVYGTTDQPVCIGKKDEDGRCVPRQGASTSRHRHRHRRTAVALSRERRPRRRVRRLQEAQTRPRRDDERGHARPRFALAACTTLRRRSGSARAYAGIGCHHTAQWMDRATEGFTQIGGEGADRIGESPFSTRRTFPKPRRRHLQPFRLAGFALGGRDRHARHLQYSLQRRRRHDRRPADRGPSHGRQDRRAGARRGRRAHRPRHRRARPEDDAMAVRLDDPSPRRPRCRATRARDGAGRVRAHLRPDWRGREAPAPETRRVRRSRQAR